MLNVFITIDTEVWPLLPDWRQAGLTRDIDRDIYGITPTGSYGILYQMDVLEQHGLKGAFFVEPLFAEVAGRDRLGTIVGEIQGRGHEVQVHIHPEWLGWMNEPLLPGPNPAYLKDFSEHDQQFLISHALELLRNSGANRLCAFRAGDYAANFLTLRALSRLGIAFDTSHNTCYLNSRCGLDTKGPVLQPITLEGVCEIPVSYFRDGPRHYRHAQLAACSWPELRSSLVQAARRGWHTFVIVSHSFELLSKRRQHPDRPRPDRVAVRRFEQLCQFLGENRDRFRTAGFADLSPASFPETAPTAPLLSAPHRTLWRMAEQLVRRCA